MSINLTTTLAPSGAFCPTSAGHAPGSYAQGTVTPEDYLIYNPGVQERYRGSYTSEQIDAKTAAWLEECKKTPIVKQSELDVYSEVCIELAKDVSSVPANLRLGPLRGAARPCLTTQVMTSGSVEFTFFNYKQGSNGKNAKRVIDELYPIIMAANPHEEIYRIQVMDTAIGGHGINALTRYLWQIKDSHAEFQKQKWELDYRIIHANDERTDIGNIEKVRSRAKLRNFEVQLNRYVVTDLMVEDSESALGMEIVGDYGNFLAKPSYKPGKIILKSDAGFQLINSQAEVVTYDELFSERITCQMEKNPEMQQIGVVWAAQPELLAANWNDYELKG